jgi:hypothetical protein
VAEQREASNAVTIGCIIVFCSPLWVAGLWTLINGMRTDAFLHTIGGIAMFGAGVLPIYVVFAAIRLAPQRKAFYKEIRAIPAHWKPEWSSGRLVDQAVETASVINAMTIASAGFSLLCGFFAFVAIRQGGWAGLVLLVVPLVLVGFVIAKIRGGMRRKRFGRSELLLDEMPAHIGHTLRGSVIIEKLRTEELAGRTFRIHVTSIRRKTWTERDRGTVETRVDSTVLWQGAMDVSGGVGRLKEDGLKEDGLWVPIEIEIPKDQQATNDVWKMTGSTGNWRPRRNCSALTITAGSRFRCLCKEKKGRWV